MIGNDCQLRQHSFIYIYIYINTIISYNSRTQSTEQTVYIGSSEIKHICWNISLDEAAEAYGDNTGYMDEKKCANDVSLRFFGKRQLYRLDVMS